jgi:cell shape-determining protein MreD
MRIAAHVFLTYALVLVLGAVWRLLPITSVPDVVALIAVYLGLTARGQVAPSTLGAVISGYLADLLLGTPRGLLALDAGIICLIGHMIHQRLLVRGRLFTIGFSFFTGLLSGTVVLIMRLGADRVHAVGGELLVLLGSALLTGLAGPVVFRICRFIDARFARTRRDRDVTVGGAL